MPLSAAQSWSLKCPQNQTEELIKRSRHCMHLYFFYFLFEKRRQFIGIHNSFPYYGSCLRKPMEACCFAMQKGNYNLHQNCIFLFLLVNYLWVMGRLIRYCILTFKKWSLHGCCYCSRLDDHLRGDRHPPLACTTSQEGVEITAQSWMESFRLIQCSVSSRPMAIE